MSTLPITVVMVVIGVLAIRQVRREALRARGVPGGVQRLKRLRYQVLLAGLMLAPGFWVLSEFNAGDTALYVLAAFLGVLGVVYLAIEAAIGWISADE